jgi:hypothetical protein
MVENRESMFRKEINISVNAAALSLWGDQTTATALNKKQQKVHREKERKLVA